MIAPYEWMVMNGEFGESCSQWLEYLLEQREILVTNKRRKLCYSDK
jgi:hypothetical protein